MDVETVARKKDTQELDAQAAAWICKINTTCDEHDLQRKVKQIRQFLEEGHRVEVRVLQKRCPPQDVLFLALRVTAEIRDLAKPESMEESVREFQEAVVAPKSRKRAPKSRKRAHKPKEIKLRLGPCTQDQAAAFRLEDIPFPSFRVVDDQKRPRRKALRKRSESGQKRLRRLRAFCEDA